MQARTPALRPVFQNVHCHSRSAFAESPAGGTRCMSNAVRTLAVALGLLLAACAAMQQQKAQASRAADTGEFHNLQVFPQNISHDELIANMRGFAKALGTRCDHCHVSNPPGSQEQLDFASDAKPEKNVELLFGAGRVGDVAVIAARAESFGESAHVRDQFVVADVLRED